MEPFVLIGFAVVAVVAFILVIVFLKFFTTWLRARVASAPVSIGKMIGMSLRKVPVGLIVDNRITAVKAGIDIASDPLEAHYLAGGDVSQVILALIAADKAGIASRFQSRLRHRSSDERHRQNRARSGTHQHQSESDRCT